MRFPDTIIDDMLLSCLVAIQPDYGHQVQFERAKGGWKRHLEEVELVGKKRFAYLIGFDDRKVHINQHPLMELRSC